MNNYTYERYGPSNDYYEPITEPTYQCSDCEKSDEKIQEISAASILAKVHRDRMCEEMHRQYPDYGFDAHKGYGTAVHLKALQTLGATPYHRKTFAPVTQAILAFQNS